MGAIATGSIVGTKVVGNGANGIFAQSVGGGGGNGGSSIALSAANDVSASVTVGGSGGVAGAGGAVTINNTGTVLTLGTLANGLWAQSVGGGGGNGGFAVSGNLSVDGPLGASVSLGGGGGAGQAAGVVQLFSNATGTLSGSTATIETDGDDSKGLYAQSIGGGGGAGGFAGSVSVGGSSSKAAIALSAGGVGGLGSDGNTVTVRSVDNILTKGIGSDGILAESVGGGGGDGGFSFAGSLETGSGKAASIALSMGGKGGTGGNAMAVNVNSTGLITTLGKNADGMLAQSIGGGGGNGGFSVDATVGTGDGSGSISGAVGGNGGTGGIAQSVTVQRNGAIATAGDNAIGLLAQSIGGGGGNGGWTLSGSLSTSGNTKDLSASVGGQGGTGGLSGSVMVTNTGAISTLGDNAQAIFAQSVGGGGGNGGFAAAVTIGRGGESTNLNASATVGGFGGSGNIGNTVQVTNVGVLSTIGTSSDGILAQSIGGGGGAGGLAFAGAVDLDSQSSGKSVNATAAVGGNGGTGGNAAAVQVNQTGSITTTGGTSNAIFAQSVGGGGGVGGRANTFSFFAKGGAGDQATKDAKEANAGKNINLSLQVGGQGGAAGNGAAVTVNTLASAGSLLSTTGDFSDGILAQSIGGGGGSGGDAVSGLDGVLPSSLPFDASTLQKVLDKDATEVKKGRNWTIAIGGSGGASGNGAIVTVNNAIAISTTGDTSYGILAQSIGGGGGEGGEGEAGAEGKVGLGGSGGAAGFGSAVTVVNTAAITTTGDAASAIFAQSVGGGGGAGGGSSGTVAIGGGGLAAVPGAAFLGYGTGTGNAGGTVTVTNSALLQTAGNSAYGIEAQSIGGGGGEGGDGGSADDAGKLGLGGAGAVAGNGGTVTVTNAAGASATTATISTTGAGASAIFAQSVGGGGGAGGGSAGEVAIGGGALAGIPVAGVATPTGGGGFGGAVLVTNNGALRTTGQLAYGIQAQSIGGGGGEGGTGGAAKATKLGLGGSGGSAGAGGTVTVNNNALILTAGDEADAIFAQSVGGGGGDSGGAAGKVALGGGVLNEAPAGVTQNVGTAGDGGAVAVTNTQALQTSGRQAIGVFAQSIGGGGGAASADVAGKVSIGGGGGSSGNGGAVTVNNSGQIVTSGAYATAVMAQSVGGGGGAGGDAVAGSAADQAADPTLTGILTLGGAGTTAGNGGLVSVTNTALIRTSGIGAYGVAAQSIGGGGGSGLGSDGKLSLGGAAGSAGNGGIVALSNAAQVTTAGDLAYGLFGQSVGGGGGVAGGANKGVVSIGGSGAAGAAGGAVTVTNSGLVSTTGNSAFAIFAQSVGGGGGTAAGAASAVQVGRSGAAGGNGGAVTVTNTAATIQTTGENSHGIFAQSIGGGGGVVSALAGYPIPANVGTVVAGAEGHLPGTVAGVLNQFIGTDGVGLAFAGSVGGIGIAGPVTVNQTGNIAATGQGSFGILAQSAGSTNGTVAVNVLSGIVEGGSQLGAGVGILDGTLNTLTNAGTITSVNAIDGYAVRATGGSDTIVNTGRIIGSVDLGTGVNTFTNATGSRYDSGATLALGTAAADLFSNAGTFSPGGVNRLMTVTETGAFAQTSTGLYEVDLGGTAAQATDRTNVSQTAAVGGTVAVNLVAPVSGTQQNVILHANGGVTNAGLTLATANTAAASYSLTFRPNDVLLNSTLNFTPGGLTATGSAVGGAINGAIPAASAVKVATVAPTTATATAVMVPGATVGLVRFARFATTAMVADAVATTAATVDAPTAQAGQTGNAATAAAAAQSDTVTSTPLTATTATPTGTQSLAATLAAIPTVEGLNSAYNALSGEAHASAATTGLENGLLLNGVILGHLEEAERLDRDGALGAVGAFGSSGAQLPAGTRGYAALGTVAPAAASDVAFWGTGFGDFGHNDATRNSAGLDRSTGGFVIGADRRLDGTLLNGWRIGAAGGYSYDQFSVRDRQSDGNYQTVFGSLYGAARYGAVDVRLGTLFGGTGTNITRSILFPGFVQQVRSNASGDVVQGFGEIGYRIPVSLGLLEPVFGGAAIHIDQGGFTEQGAGAALRGVARGYDLETTTLGVRGEFAPFGDLAIVGRGFLGWRHAFGDVNPTALLAFTAGSTPFAVAGAPLDRDALVSEAGLDYRATSAITLGVSYQGQIGARAEDHAVKGRFEVRF